jgi:hypothetical protein
LDVLCRGWRGCGAPGQGRHGAPVFPRRVGFAGLSVLRGFRVLAGGAGLIVVAPDLGCLAG